jgi:hypothetical protein
MARVREDLLQCTDERIIEESELLDELARRVAALEDQVQEDREEEEEDDVSVSTRGSMLPPTARQFVASCIRDAASVVTMQIM